MSETKKFVVIDGPINHDQELYQNGDTIELLKKAAERLEREKKVVPFKEEKKNGKPGDPGDGKGQKEGSESQKSGAKEDAEKSGSKVPGQKEDKDKKGGKK